MTNHSSNKVDPLLCRDKCITSGNHPACHKFASINRARWERPPQALMVIRRFRHIFSGFPMDGMVFRAWKKNVFGKTKGLQLGFRQVYDFDQLQGRDARYVQDANLRICSCERAKV